MRHTQGIVTIKIKYTLPHGKRTVYQRAIPSDLQDRYGKRIIKIIIPSQIPAVVAREASRLTQAVEAEWAMLRKDSEQAPKAVAKTAAEYLRQWGLEPLDGRTTADHPDGLPTPREAAINLLADFLEGSAPPFIQANPELQAPEPVKIEAWKALHEVPAKRISDVLKVYLATHPKRHQPKPMGMVKVCFDRLISVLGDKPIDQVSRKDVERFKVWEMETEGNKTATVRRRLSVFSAAWNRYRREEEVAGMLNPFEHQEIVAEGKDATKRIPHTQAELEKLYTMCRQKDDSLRWLFAMLIDTGARVSEVAGLPLADIHLHDAHGRPLEAPYVVFQPHPWRSIKTDESRSVPLVGASLWAAQRIMERAESLGGTDGAIYAFPRYIKTNKKTGLPECNGTIASNTLNHWSRAQGIDKVNHELRHAMEDRLRDVECPKPIADSITGHGKTDVADAYGNGWSVKVKHGWLEKVALAACSHLGRG